MHIELIREKIAEKLNNSEDFWSYRLTDTNPGNYGINEWEVNAIKTNIQVDIPNRNFTFKKVKFTFDIRLDSSGKDGFNKSFCILVDGEGEFDFLESEIINLKQLKLTTNLDLYS